MQVIKDHYLRILSPLAKRWDFTIRGFGEEGVKPGKGAITLAAHDELEPSPTADPNDERFDWLTGTIRGVFGEDVVVAPMLLTGI